MTFDRKQWCASALAVLLAGSVANAQQSAPIRTQGTIASMAGTALALKPATGPDMTITLPENAQVYAVLPAAAADIKAGDFIAVTAMPQPDGSQKAGLIIIFPETMRGVGEGFRPWDRPAGSTMTNATVDSTVAGVDGQTATVKYKGGEKNIIISPDTAVRAYVPGERSELKPGAHIAIPRVEKAADGTLTAARVYVGRNGIVPE
jgi:hypothetical protein